MLSYVTGKDVFHHLTGDACQGNWSIVSWITSLSPFLKIAVILAVFQSMGTSPICKDWVNISFNTGTSTDAKFFSIHVDTWSGPTAFMWFSAFKSFSTPFVEISIPGMVLCLLGPLHVDGIFDWSSSVKIDLYCSESASAFAVVCLTHFGAVVVEFQSCQFSETSHISRVSLPG